MLVVSEACVDMFPAIVVKNAGSSLIAAAISLRVFSAAGALSLRSASRAVVLEKYDNAVHAEEPLPILNLFVSVSNPISPAASVGFAAVHWAAVPLRCCILVAIFYFSLWGLPIII